MSSTNNLTHYSENKLFGHIEKQHPIEYQILSASVKGNKIMDETPSALKSHLKGISVLYDAKIPSDVESVAILVSALKTDFGKYTLEEMLTAHRMNLSGNLQMKADDEILTPYGNISVKFIAQVMDRYSKKKHEARQISERNKSLPEGDPETTKTDSEQYDMMIRLIKKLGELPRMYPYWKVYHYMLRSGKISAPNEQRWSELRVLARTKLAREKRQINPDTLETVALKFLIKEFVEFETGLKIDFEA